MTVLAEAGFLRHNRTLLLLVGAAAASLLVSLDGAIGAFAGIVTLVLAGIKGRLVLLDFMELRHAPWQWRVGFEGGLVTVTATLGALYLAGGR